MNDEQLLKKIAQRLTEEGPLDGAHDGELIEQFLDALERGKLRCAQKSLNGWMVDERVKQGILLAFRLGKKEIISLGPLTFIDKHTILPQRFDAHDDVRIVPGAAAVRRGSHVGQGVVIMSPSYVNIGAFIDDGCMVDSNALVGSCAQVGKRVHISAGAQIGGVLEPVGALPVIIEDDVLIGGNCGIYEGCLINERAVLGAGVVLTKSTKVFDLVNETVITAGDHGGLVIPPCAVVVSGMRLLNSDFAKLHGLGLNCGVIIKYRDQQTDQKTKLEDLLRMSIN